MVKPSGVKPSGVKPSGVKPSGAKPSGAKPSGAKQHAAILGGGSFGTALANIVAQNGYPSFLWVRDAQRAKKIQAARENSAYLPGYPLHDNLEVTSDLTKCVVESDVLVIAIPSSGYREVVRAIAPSLRPETLLVSATKGVQAPDFTLMSQILEQELQHPNIGVLSGPNFAKEIVQGHHTASVIASDSAEVLTKIPPMFSSSTFRVYTNDDRFGVELAGALKNIYAIISGMANALGCGHNTQAMLLTRSLAEMGRFAKHLGANYTTLLGLAGVGDLILTCGSNLSRNYQVGHLLGEGKTLEEATAEVGQVAEGVNTLKMVKHKADALGVYMPLVSGLNAILFEKQDIAKVVEQLMSGEMNKDVDFDPQ